MSNTTNSIIKMSVVFNINEIGSRFSLDDIDLDPPKVIVRATGLEDRVIDGTWELYNDDNNEMANFISDCVNNMEIGFVFNLPMTLSSLDSYGTDLCGPISESPK